jgi:hypothetical protein
MLKRKWMTDNTGRLVCVWSDCNTPRGRWTYLHEQAVAQVVQAPRSRISAGTGWFRRVSGGAPKRALFPLSCLLKELGSP